MSTGFNVSIIGFSVRFSVYSQTVIRNSHFPFVCFHASFCDVKHFISDFHWNLIWFSYAFFYNNDKFENMFLFSRDHFCFILQSEKTNKIDFLLVVGVIRLMCQHSFHGLNPDSMLRMARSNLLFASQSPCVTYNKYK